MATHEVPVYAKVTRSGTGDGELVTLRLRGERASVELTLPLHPTPLDRAALEYLLSTPLLQLVQMAGEGFVAAIKGEPPPTKEGP